MNELLGAALLIAAMSLVIRRKAFGCRWEGAPSIVVVSAPLAAYLTSPIASRQIGPWLHSITWIWNFEDLLGHVAAVVCVAAAVYIFLCRFGGQQSYWELVLRPIALAVPLLVTCRALGESGQHYVDNFDEIRPGPWLVAYWAVIFSIGSWLLALALRFALQLILTDGTRRQFITLNLYIAAIATTALFLALLSIQVYTDFNTRTAAFSMGYLSVACWSLAPAYSWWHKSRPLVIAKPDELASSE